MAKSGKGQEHGSMNWKIVGKATVALLTITGLLGQHAIALAGDPHLPAARGQAGPQVVDIELATGGILRGRVVDARGVPQVDAEVTLAQQQRTIASTRSGADGQFTMSNLKGGTYHAVTQHGVSVFRLWAHETAPPRAPSSVMLVSDASIVAGQHAPLKLPHAPLKVWLADPFVIAGIVAIATAVPIAVANSRDSES
ncbi:MAG: carboxypeptidase regulatory-like domain-containing protein [Planctomycetota bacterium]|nr:MAG: carboxypeptidase regulatory-like domain-containing protein [Planctomycetota bacterium]REK46550.1 MAG: carboxypeptidase regulatory-like domain-containing protein [Planctomycetota bacterium]